MLLSCKEECYFCTANCVYVKNSGQIGLGYCDYDFDDYATFLHFVDSVTMDASIDSTQIFDSNNSFCDNKEQLDFLVERGLRCEER